MALDSYVANTEGVQSVLAISGPLKAPFSIGCWLEKAGYPKWDEDTAPRCDEMAEFANLEEEKLRLGTISASKLNSFLV